MTAFAWGRHCPNGHGELARVVATCHDWDSECECEQVHRCEACGYQHFSTCANASPEEIGEPHDGDTYRDGEEEWLRYDGTRCDWFEFTPTSDPSRQPLSASVQE